MQCKFCSLEGRVLESRPSSLSEFFRKRRYVCPNDHRFNTFEIPEELFNSQKNWLMIRLEQFIRGVKRRSEFARQTVQIDRLLAESDMTYEEIARIANCSKSKVEKRVQVRKSCLS